MNTLKVCLFKRVICGLGEVYSDGRKKYARLHPFTTAFGFSEKKQCVVLSEIEHLGKRRLDA